MEVSMRWWLAIRQKIFEDYIPKKLGRFLAEATSLSSLLLRSCARHGGEIYQEPFSQDEVFIKILSIGRSRTFKPKLWFYIYFEPFSIYFQPFCYHHSSVIYIRRDWENWLYFDIKLYFCIAIRLAQLSSSEAQQFTPRSPRSSHSGSVIYRKNWSFSVWHIG